MTKKYLMFLCVVTKENQHSKHLNLMAFKHSLDIQCPASNKLVKLPETNLGRSIASWGFGAEMMYSLNFGFWSSKSFAFSPDDFTSGFTGSGGFSLLWGPFVQPCKKTVPYWQAIVVQANTTKKMWQSIIFFFFFFFLKSTNTFRRHDCCNVHDSEKRENRKLTAMLRKSEKSVVLLLQQDHPWEDFTETLVLTTKDDQICVFSNYFTFKASWNTGTPGWYVQPSVKKNKKNT